ncbi:hypothetical protein ACSSWA_11330 [Melioribacter sp. Ez-97]|uniref:hypothetical protein n=1 Tax=Melioribacter sp. Ez-97 TaxID=3423434 RepID=UPI003EDA3643
MKIPFAKYLRPIKRIWVILKKHNYSIKNIVGIFSSNEAKRHPLVSIKEKNGFSIIEIQEYINLPIYDNKEKKDRGYHKFGNTWWYNLNCPYSFHYFDINSFYPKKYFKTECTGHPDSNVGEEIYHYMQKVYQNLFGKTFDSVLELGTGGGRLLANLK